MQNHANLAGPAIARARRQRNLTQGELQKLCRSAGLNMARSVLAKIETRSRSLSDIELVAIARALKVEVSVLLKPAAPKRKSRPAK